MLTPLFNVINFFKNVKWECAIEFFKTLGLYSYDLLLEIYQSIKSMNKESLMYILFALLTFVTGFNISIITMIVYTCYVKHFEGETCLICNHENIFRYALVIILIGLLHCIF